MKKKGFRSVRRNKRRTMQTGGGHAELITSIVLEDYEGVEANIENLPQNKKDAEAKPNDIFEFPVKGRTALYLACRLPNPNPEIVKLLLDNEFRPNSRNNGDANLGNGAFPLHGVVEAIKETIAKTKIPKFSKILEIIQLLKDSGAILGVKNSHGLTAYDEYEAYVKPTTSKLYEKDDLDLDTALKRQDAAVRGSPGQPPPPPPGQPSMPVSMPPRTQPRYSGVPGYYVPSAGQVSFVPPPDTRHRPLYAAAVTTLPTGQGAAAVWEPPTGVPDTRLTNRSSSYTAAAAAVAVHSPVAATHNMRITIQPTKSLTPGFSLQTATDIDSKNAFVLHPSLVTFQRTIGKKCKGMSLNYNGGVIKLPDNGGDFNGIHLQVLARNESVNTTGVMQTSLYGGVLSVEEIATIRCLVKNTTVVGLTYPEKNGGYGGHLPPPHFSIDRKLTIIVDQCGLQFQESIYNTGALFFYPEEDDNTVIFEGTDQNTRTTLGEYRRWQNATYREMYGEERPPVDLAADPGAAWTVLNRDKNRTVRWKLRGNLKSPVVGFKTEFMQAFHSVHFMAERTPAIKTVHFKFLRAGLGFFSENILLAADIVGDAPTRTEFLETARLRGIYHGIRKLGGAPVIMARTKIKKIILPFQTFAIQDINSFGDFLVTGSKVAEAALGMHADKAALLRAEDALAQNADHTITIATTNCADPHAGPGNEGGYHSVDAAIASNTYVHHLNAAYNYANIQSALFEVVSLPHSTPAAAHGSAQLVHPAYHLPGAAIYPYSPGAAARSFAAVVSIPPPSIRPDSPRGQRGCFGAACKWFKAVVSNRSRVAPAPEGGKNRNRKLQKLQKQQKQRTIKKNKNKKQSRRRGQRQPRRCRGSRRAS